MSKLSAFALIFIACISMYSTQGGPHYIINKEFSKHSLFVPPTDTDVINCIHAYTIVVLGSSTSFGTGASTMDSSYVSRFAAYVRSKNASSNIINLALGGYTTYQVLCPTGFTPPSDRPSPDAGRNITAALSYNPDAIIINLPTNDVANGFWLSEQKANYARAIALADAANVPVWVTTSQPRNDISNSMRDSLKAQRDWVYTQFGDKALDFWSTVADADGKIVTSYKSDDIHVNNSGHYIFFSRVVSKKILDTICTRLGFTPPVIMHSNPENNSTNANRNLTVSLNFDKPITTTGTGKIELRRFSNDALVESFTGNDYNVVLSSGNVSLHFNTMLSNATKYYLLIEQGAFFNSDNISFKGINDKNTFSFTTSVPLPLQLLSFNAAKSENGIQLKWATGNELNTKEFIIERSVDGKSFEAVSTISTKGDGNNLYEYNDMSAKNLPAIYYRMKMIDKDGGITYSNIISAAKDNLSPALQVNPNPVNDYIKLTSSSISSGILNIYDQSGIRVLSKRWKTNEVVPVGNFPAGQYYLQLITGTQIQNGKFLK
ncbi:GDSL-type esterase/lipase family protein [Ferruginibacter albus]|uniref:GDSL-type esterase/lipase family protein n=1 Tax=Ferruginibacter albus TaxID=2875540 RepID=UPI001CC52C05|nr:GDSL-type esterase/lipase family protein [Ferruginibacter albus]UAY52416.1 Ig-like domain-containing protein [Ferruginibacter albus]